MAIEPCEKWKDGNVCRLRKGHDIPHWYKGSVLPADVIIFLLVVTALGYLLFHVVNDWGTLIP